MPASETNNPKISVAQFSKGLFLAQGHSPVLFEAIQSSSRASEFSIGSPAPKWPTNEKWGRKYRTGSGCITFAHI